MIAEELDLILFKKASISFRHQIIFFAEKCATMWVRQTSIKRGGKGFKSTNNF